MSVYRKAVNAWGVDSQAMIVAEECCELVTALSQFLRGRVATMAVVEEIADVQIMLHQTMEILALRTGRDVSSIEEMVDIMLNAKVSRLQLLIDGPSAGGVEC